MTSHYRPVNRGIFTRIYSFNGKSKLDTCYCYGSKWDNKINRQRPNDSLLYTVGYHSSGIAKSTNPCPLRLVIVIIIVYYAIYAAQKHILYTHNERNIHYKNEKCENETWQQCNYIFKCWYILCFCVVLWTVLISNVPQQSSTT